MSGISVSKICIPFGGGGTPMSAEYKAVYDEMVVKPSGADATIQATWIDGMVAGGYYAKAEFLDLFSCDTQANSLFNWRDPAGARNPILVNAPAFTAYSGFKGNSVGNKYVRTNVVPLTDLTVASLDSTCWIVGIGDNVAEDKADFGSNDNGVPEYMGFYSCAYGGNMYLRVSGVATYTAVNANSIGHYAASRQDALGFDAYKNLVRVYQASASNSLSPNELFVCGHNSNLGITVNNKTIRYAFLFSGLSEAEVTGVITLTEAYLDNYGTGLI